MLQGGLCRIPGLCMRRGLCMRTWICRGLCMKAWKSRAMALREGRYSDSHEVATTSIHPSIHPPTTHRPDFAGSVPARPRSRASLFLPRYLFTRLGPITASYLLDTISAHGRIITALSVHFSPKEKRRTGKASILAATSKFLEPLPISN